VHSDELLSAFLELGDGAVVFLPPEV
jgi:hypothetical protein